MKLSERSTLIIPVEVSIEPSLALGRIAFVAKTEHHYTVLGYAIGKHLKKAMVTDSALAEGLAALIARFDFSFQVGSSCFHVVQRAAETLQTVVVSIEAPVARFFQEAIVLVDPGKGEAHAALHGALEEPPPAHITFYTTDPKGKAGIGLNRERDLDEAMVRAATHPQVEGLLAYRLAPGILQVASAKLVDEIDPPAG